MMASLPFSWITLSSRSKSNMPGLGRRCRRFLSLFSQSPNECRVSQMIDAKSGRHQAGNHQGGWLDMRGGNEQILPTHEETASRDKKTETKDNERTRSEMLSRQQADAVK